MGSNDASYDGLMSKFQWGSFDLDQLQFPVLEGNRSLAAIVLCLVLYLFYYIFFVVNKPKVVGGGCRFMKHLLAHCPSLKEYYWPTFWAFHHHLTTVLRVFLQKSPPVRYEREIFTLKDGGEVALDWAQVPEETPEDAPILLVIPGITGGSSDTYIMYLAWDGIVEGYRSVVFNQRGCGGLLLKTPRTYCATNIEDMTEVLQRVHALYPTAPVVGIGVSLGGMILTQYLHRTGSDCDLKAAIVICPAWDSFKSQYSIETKLANKYIYSRFLSSQLRELARRNLAAATPEQLEELNKYNVNKVLQAQSVAEFDTLVTVPLFGYSSLHDYYTDATNYNKVHLIRRPFFCLTAADDPFVPKDSLPFGEFEKNPLTVMAMTTHGGHFGYLTGILPRRHTWMDTVCRQVLRAMKDYQQ